MSQDNGIRRDEWTILVEQAEALEAAKVRQRFHERRAKHWKAERDKTARQLKKVGVQIVPDMFNNATVTSVKYSGARHERVEVDNKLLQKLNNENNKVEEHKSRARDYKRWVDFFDHKEASAELPFTMLDMQFFGLITDELTGESDD
jgi:histidinol-phosphate/aromatic aminotransferase/cobyric acid decarboxylase-like protein